VSYKASDMNQAKTPSWLVRPRRRATRRIDGSSARASRIFFSALANSKLLPLGPAVSPPPTRAR
jgi:hypothetical protein